MPQVLIIADEIMYQIGLRGVNAQLAEGYGQPPGLCMEGVKVNHHQNDIGEIRGCLSIEQEIIIIHIVKLQVPGSLQCRIFPPDFVDPGNEFPDGSRFIPIPVLDFVFFRILVLFFAWKRIGNTLLKRRAKDTIA